MAALLNQLEGAQADVDSITQLVYKYTQCIEDRLPVLSHARGAGHEALGLDVLNSDNVNLHVVDQERWRYISRDAGKHLASLLQAHNLVVAVADVCQEAVTALIAVHTASEPLLLSTGREVLHTFMHLFCSTTRMALLLNELPRRHIASLMQACHHLLNEQANSRAGSAGGGASFQTPTCPLEPLPDTDLPVYQATSMVSFIQHLMQPLAPRVQQVMELSVAPALFALFPNINPKPQNKTNTSTTPRANANTSHSQLPNIFHIPDPSLPSTAPADTGSDPDQRQSLTIHMEKPDKHVLLGPGGMQLQVAHAACLTFDLLQQWVLLGYLACPAALSHPGSIDLLTHALIKEVSMQLHEERCCWIGLLHMQSLGALDSLPALPGTQAAQSSKAAKRQRIQMMVEARAAVQQAVVTALQDGSAWQSLLRLECLQQLQQATAMCTAHPRLLAAHMPKLLGLLGLSRHAVLWQCRHLGFLAKLPPALRKLVPGQRHASQAGAASSAGGGAQGYGSNMSSGGGSWGQGSDIRLGRQDRTSGAVSLSSRVSNTRIKSSSTNLSVPGIAQALLGVPGGGMGEGVDPAVGRIGAALPETDKASLLSVLQLMKSMEELVDLMDAHISSIRERLRNRAAQLLQRHVIPGHVRLAASKLGSPALAVTLYDVELMLTQVRGLLQQPDPPADPVPASAIKLVWRLLQQHTLMASTSIDNTHEDADLGQGLAPAGDSASHAPETLDSSEAPGQVPDTAAGASEAAAPGADAVTPRATGWQGMPTPSPGQTPLGHLGRDTAQPAAPGEAKRGGATAGGKKAGLGLEAGLPAAQVAAITQDPLFFNALQEISQLVEWYTLPDEMLSRAAGLQYLTHVPDVVMSAVNTCLASTHTSPLAMVVIKALHWISQKPPSSTHAGGQQLAEQLAMQVMGCVTARLQSSLSPLLQPSCVGATEPATADAVALPRDQVLPAILPLSMAMAEAGVVQVSRDMAVVPLEYLRETVLECLVALLRNLATDITAQHRFKGGCWQPRVALDCVSHVLVVASSLQRALGIHLQEQLMHVLYYCGSPDAHVAGLLGADSDGVTASGRAQEELRASRQADAHKASTVCLHAMLEWYSTHVLQDVNQQGCVYSPTLCCFMLSAPASTPLTTTRQAAASRSNISGGGMMPDRHAPGKGQGGKSRSDRLKRDVPASALPKPGSLMNRGSSAAGFAAAGAPETREVLVCMHDLVHLLELFGPQAATLLSTACNELMQKCMDNLDQQLLSRFKGLVRIAGLLDLPAGSLDVGAPQAQPDPQAAQGLINSMLASVRGVFCPAALVQVQELVATLARCLGFRSLLSQAMQAAAARHAPVWAAGIPLLAIPQASISAMEEPATGSLGSATSAPPDVLPEEPGLVTQDTSTIAGQASVVNAVHLAATQRAYVDIWQLPREHLRAGPVQPAALARPALPSGPCNNLSRTDPVFVQLLKRKLHDPASCQHWVMLPVLLGFVGGATSLGTLGAALDALQLCAGQLEEHVHIIQAVAQGWQTSLMQKAAGQVSWPVGMPTEQHALEQYQVVCSAVQAAKRRSQVVPGALGGHEQPHGQAASGVGAEQLRWAAAFTAVRG